MENLDDKKVARKYSKLQEKYQSPVKSVILFIGAPKIGHNTGPEHKMDLQKLEDKFGIKFKND